MSSALALMSSAASSADEQPDELIAQDEKIPDKETLAGLDRANVVGYVVSCLLNGVVYRQGQAQTFGYLLRVERDVREYVGQIGLQLIVDDAEGYAYLISKTMNDYPKGYLPPQKLTRTVSLGFFACLLLITLRKRLIEFDSSQEGTRLILSGQEIIEYVRTFIKDGTNAARIDDKLSSAINQAEKLGFLAKRDKDKEVRQCRYEVRRIIRAFFDAKNINSMDELLGRYLKKLEQDETDRREEKTSDGE